MIEEHIVHEEQFINILLNDKDAVRHWLATPFGIHYFSEIHRNLLRAITWAYNEGVQLTRQSYKLFADQIAKSGPEAIAEMAVYHRIQMRLTKRDDFPALIQRIRHGYIRRKTLENFQNYEADRKRVGELDANRVLAQKLQALETETLESKTAFIDLGHHKDEFIKDLMYRRENPTKRITCGISEIDDTMSVGFIKGGLTIFSAGPGSYKCVRGSVLLQLENGQRITAREYFEQFADAADRPRILSLNEETQRLYFQDVSHVQSNGVKQCYRIKTRLGYHTDVTGNHPVLTFSGYKRADEIADDDFIAISRRMPFGDRHVPRELAIWLGCMLADGGTSQVGYRFTNVDSRILKEMEDATKLLGGDIVRVSDGGIDYRINGLRNLGKTLGLDGKLSIDKRLPPDVFQWDKDSVSNLLRAMYSCDGHVSKNTIMYCTSSYGLAQDVRDLLLRFGLVAKLFQFESKCGEHRRQAYRVILQNSPNLVTFISTIGFIGDKEQKASKIIERLKKHIDNPNVDLVPSSIWPLLKAKFKQHGKSFFQCRRLAAVNGLEGNCGHVNKGISRRVLGRIANFLNDDEIKMIAESDVLWDRAISVEPVAVEETYDIAMPTHHNFVCDNIVTHNTTIMLNVALNIFHLHDENVLFLPLEMPADMMMQKIISRETRIPFDDISKPEKLKDAQIRQIEEEFDKWRDLSNRFKVLKIADRAKVSNIRAEIDKRISYFQPRIVVIDYIDNVVPESSGQREDLKLRDMFEDMIKMGDNYGFHVVTAAKLTRDSLKRLRDQGENKQELDSTDLHGGQELGANATAVYGQLKNKQQPGKLMDFFCMKSRYGKQIFANGRLKTHLNIIPECGIIESESNSLVDAWNQHPDAGAVSQEIMSQPPADIEEDSPF